MDFCRRDSKNLFTNTHIHNQNLLRLVKEKDRVFVESKAAFLGEGAASMVWKDQAFQKKGYI